MNPIYQYIIYGLVIFVLLGILGYKIYRVYQERGAIKFSKDLGESFKFTKNDKEEISDDEEINEIRVPKQAELNLSDENDGKFIVIHLSANVGKLLELEILQQKLFANDLVFKNGYFESSDTSFHKGFRILNTEEPGTFLDSKPIKMMSIVLHLRGQRNVSSTFDKMLNLARNIAQTFDMKLLDENFNSISDQTIGSYKNLANDVDLRAGPYAN